MAEVANVTDRQTSGPSGGNIVRSLLSGALVPALAVFTALLCGAALIWLTTGRLEVVARAYIGLWEGSFGRIDSITSTLVRTAPFIIAGLAVALSFKAGLFNVGAEGQLYAGALASVLVGFSLQGLPSIIHVPLAIFAGALAGMLWGAIPGALKAFTGAHEVINTIMLNFIAIRLTDWLIKSKEPLLLLDPSASTPKTPPIAESAKLPVLLVDRVPLHGGLLMALILVFVVYWLLYRTTIGFELRTVGANSEAARYAGMSVKRTIIMAMAFSGLLCGLAGAGEILGHQYSMQPDFFSGLGFDSIAIALLARSNPFAIIPAALLWGGLLSGAGLMQVRSNLSIDLIKIIQALIIMFVAAEQIIRWLYRLRAARSSDSTTFSRGWGG